MADAVGVLDPKRHLKRREERDLANLAKFLARDLAKPVRDLANLAEGLAKPLVGDLARDPRKDLRKDLRRLPREGEGDLGNNLDVAPGNPRRLLLLKDAAPGNPRKLPRELRRLPGGGEGDLASKLITSKLISAA